MDQSAKDLVTRDISNKLEELGTRHLMAKAFADDVIQDRVDTGEVIELTDDEQRLLKAYRSFLCRAQQEDVFKWRPPKQDGIVIAQDPVLIRDAQDLT